MSVLITVPHGYCEKPCSEGRQCDCTAAHWGRRLFQRLKALSIPSDLFVSATPRSELDLNRPWSRQSHFRLAASEAMQRAWLVLDIHSYPPPHWADYNAVILDDRRPTPQSALAFSAATGIPLDPNGLNNDIQDEAHASGKQAFLIEFNEQGNSAIQSGYIDAIVAWIQHQRPR